MQDSSSGPVARLRRTAVSTNPTVEHDLRASAGSKASQLPAQFSRQRRPRVVPSSAAPTYVSVKSGLGIKDIKTLRMIEELITFLQNRMEKCQLPVCDSR